MDLKIMKRNMKPAATVLSAVFGGLVVMVAIQLAAVGKETSASPKISVENSALNQDVKAATSLAPVIKKVTPSVVNIYSTRTIRMQQFWQPFMDDPRLRRFFGEEDGPRRRQQPTHKSQSLGSGVIVSEDGYILTNNHVVEGADKDGVEVALADGKTKYTAKVVGTDPRTEVAILKVDARQLPAITLTDSDKLEVGDLVLAVGNPFGVGQSVTKGIISALGRANLPGGQVTEYEDFIQIDASINPGNSGGPLVDAEGRLIGINTFIASSSGASAGVGFAIPVNLAKSVMDRLLKDGKVTRGYLGLLLQQEITADLAREFKLPDQSGALVAQVESGTPAAEAGIKEGDAIIEFDGKKVSDFRHFRLMVSQTAPETKVTLKLIRDGREKTVTATVGEMPEDGTVAKRSRPEEKAAPSDALDGVEVTDIDNASRKQLDIPARLRGALVTKVEEGSESYDAGLRAGDVILEIDRQPVQNANEAVELSGKVEDNRVLLRVWSNGGSRFMVVNNNTKRK
jgi:serine protease Do